MRARSPGGWPTQRPWEPHPAPHRGSWRSPTASASSVASHSPLGPWHDDELHRIFIRILVSSNPLRLTCLHAPHVARHLFQRRPCNQRPTEAGAPGFGARAAGAGASLACWYLPTLASSKQPSLLLRPTCCDTEQPQRRQQISSSLKRQRDIKRRRALGRRGARRARRSDLEATNCQSSRWGAPQGHLWHLPHPLASNDASTQFAAALVAQRIVAILLRKTGWPYWLLPYILSIIIDCNKVGHLKVAGD